LGVVAESEVRGKILLASIALYVWKPLNLQRAEAHLIAGERRRQVVGDGLVAPFPSPRIIH
jgi:hypothetical protein